MTDERATKLDAIVTALIGAGVAGLTRSEIAKVLGIKKSPYLLQLIEQVENDGHAVKEFFEHCYPPRFVYYYKPQVKQHDH